MDLGNIRQPNRNLDPGLNSQNVADAASAVFGVKKKKVKVHRSKVKDIAKGLAEIAYSVGETNDEEGFADEIADDIFKALKQVEEREKNKPNR